MQTGTRNCSPAPGLALRKVVFPSTLLSRVLFFADAGMFVASAASVWRGERWLCHFPYVFT